MLEKVKALFEAWNSKGIDYCHWKSTNHLDATIQGLTDLDVLVDPTMSGLAEQFAVDVGFKRLDTVPLRSYPGVHDFVCLDESGVWVHIHLHYQLVLGDRWVKAYWLPVVSAILEHAEFSERYASFVVRPDDELYLFCARMALKYRNPFGKGSIRGEFEHIRALDRRQPAPTMLLAGQQPAVEELVQLARVENDLSNARLNRVARQARSELKVFRRFNLLQFRALSLWRQSYRYFVEFHRRVLKRYEFGRRRIPEGGLIVAFIGIDGCGKTSAVQRMERLFAQQMNVARVFMGNGRSGASWYRKAVLSVLGSRASWKGHRRLKASIVGEETTSVPWYYTLWMSLCLHDKVANFRKAIAGKANGSLVLSDRWPQSRIPKTFDGPRLPQHDHLGGIAGYVGKKEKKFLEAVEHVSPDLVLRFRVSPSVARARKPGELSEVEAEENASLLNAIQWPTSSVVDIDADADVDNVDRAVRVAIWDAIRGVR